MKKKRLKMARIIAAVSFAVLFAVLFNSGGFVNRTAEAETQKETVKLRILGTTDVHGQVNSKDYEQGVDYSNGGLARLYDLLNRTRNEVPAESVITLDAGDTLYDYTTEYIFAENQNAIQPVYMAMAQMGYDAITLGNHDFDYGYEYILRQLNGSGLKNITIVSNVTDSQTGEYPFLENMLITRTLTSSAGNKIDVKIGIIGQTIPTLTSKTHSYKGILKTEDMVTNARTQAQKLREMGADVVICVSHTGIGPENPEPNFKNVAYALSKIDEIDVVVCGHEHNMFPTTDMTSPYYMLPGVDKKTYLMNGTNVIMAGNRGSSLGVVDLTLTVYRDHLSISDRSSELRMVTEKNTTENKNIANLFGDWEEELLNYSTDVIARLEKGELIHNFYGMLGDNAAIQLLNDAKIDYVQRYVQTVGTQYKDYPIVAVSSYAAYGADNINDFINIQEDITESDLTAIQPYNNYIYIYTITGKQLREWLEWSASAFETTVTGSKWSNGVMSSLMQETGLKSLIREDWLDDWSNFYIFDGVDYVINPFTEPRYDLSGNRISVSSRVSELNYNGKPVTDDMEFLIASNKITQPSTANRGVETQTVLNGFVRTQTVLSKYMRQIADDEGLIPKIDNNWRINMDGVKNFIVKVPYYAASLFEKTDWHVNYLKDADSYKYYIASYPLDQGDTVAPHIVATPVITSATASPYKIVMNITDRSAIKSVRYAKGNENLEYFNSHTGLELKNAKVGIYDFTVSENGTYTIFAEDVKGNQSLYHVTINNFRDDLLSSPAIDTYTNRKTKISGRGEPGTTVVFEAHTGIYEGEVNKDGTFSYALPAQPSGTVVSVYLKDPAKGLESARVNVPVKRTGPNQPSVNPIKNTSGVITGELGDQDASLIITTSDTVYVARDGGKERYEKNTEIYNPSLEVVEVDLEKNDQGYFAMMVPPLKAGAALKIYSLDHISRNSRVYTETVSDAGPNAPRAYEISNIENTLNGYIPDVKEAHEIMITLDGNRYTTFSDANGNFTYQFGTQLHAGDVITIMAVDRKLDTIRYSYATQLVVRDIEERVSTDSTDLVFNRISDQSYLISGSYEDIGNLYLAITTGTGPDFKSTLCTVETDGAGAFWYDLDERLEAGTVVYAMVRFSDSKILTASKTEVLASQPDTPVLVKEITNSDQKVQLAAKKDSEIELTVGSAVYKTKAYEYDEVNNRYLYTFTIERAASGTEVKATASNAMGTSKAVVSKVKKAAPDQPTVKEIKKGDTLITGKVQLLDYTVPEDGTASNEETAADIFKDAPEKVAKTQTRVFAQIGNKFYEGKINDKGEYSIEIPAQKAKTEIGIWAMNKAGRGPQVKVKVK
ncbi:2',3'-cyclic-nucleotide 2'-phosphodiesterase/3'-nucleotidase [Anaerotaenia torta]|uniref:Ig-like domain-containing protein n=1 Tax=Anaerotaenia torta TaxID=433293 RepID=UPI003D1C68CC